MSVCKQCNQEHFIPSGEFCLKCDMIQKKRAYIEKLKKDALREWEEAKGKLDF